VAKIPKRALSIVDELGQLRKKIASHEGLLSRIHGKLHLHGSTEEEITEALSRWCYARTNTSDRNDEEINDTIHDDGLLRSKRAEAPEPF